MEDQSQLVQRHVALAPADVAPQRGEQRRQQRGPHQRLLLRQRVGQPHRLPARVVAGQPEHVGHPGRDERVGEHLDVPGLGQRPADRAPAALRRGQPVAGRRDRQHAGHLVVPVEPDHLLDQVGRVGQVGPPGRRRHHRAVPCRPRRPSQPTSVQQRDDPRRRVAARRPAVDGPVAGSRIGSRGTTLSMSSTRSSAVPPP